MVQLDIHLAREARRSPSDRSRQSDSSDSSYLISGRRNEREFYEDFFTAPIAVAHFPDPCSAPPAIKCLILSVIIFIKNFPLPATFSTLCRDIEIITLNFHYNFHCINFKMFTRYFLIVAMINYFTIARLHLCTAKFRASFWPKFPLDSLTLIDRRFVKKTLFKFFASLICGNLI